MILELLKKLQSVFKSASAEDGKPKIRDPVKIMRESYHDLLRLAEQINAHAERAPYPHVAQRLQQIALEKRESLTLLGEKILNLRGKLDEPQLRLKSGNNHWERISRDIEDQKAMQNKLLEQSILLAEDALEISDLLKRIGAVELSHKERLLDIVMRADPQAYQS